VKGSISVKKVIGFGILFFGALWVVIGLGLIFFAPEEFWNMYGISFYNSTLYVVLIGIGMIIAGYFIHSKM